MQADEKAKKRIIPARYVIECEAVDGRTKMRNILQELSVSLKEERNKNRLVNAAETSKELAKSHRFNKKA